MHSRSRQLAIYSMAIAALGSFGVYATAHESVASSKAVANADIPSAVEDFSYPNAAQILQDKGIKLIRGDGHITLAECNDTASQIKVMTVKDAEVNRDGLYCFQATGKGFVTLELQRVFALETADRPISADLNSQGKSETVDLVKDDYKSVGEGAVGGDRSTLVAIRVTG